MIYCYKCGLGMNENVCAYCYKCGTKISSVPPAPVQPQYPTQSQYEMPPAVIGQQQYAAPIEPAYRNAPYNMTAIQPAKNNLGKPAMILGIISNPIIMLYFWLFIMLASLGGGGMSASGYFLGIALSSLVLGIPALILGIRGRSHAKTAKSGRATSTTGFILGTISTAISAYILFILLIVWTV